MFWLFVVVALDNEMLIRGTCELWPIPSEEHTRSCSLSGHALPAEENLVFTSPDWLIVLLNQYPIEVIANLLMLFSATWSVPNSILRVGQKIFIEGSIIFLLGVDEQPHPVGARQEQKCWTLSDPGTPIILISGRCGGNCYYQGSWGPCKTNGFVARTLRKSKRPHVVNELNWRHASLISQAMVLQTDCVAEKLKNRV